MLKIIPKLLTGDHLKAVRSTIETANFVDGKLSAGSIAIKVKNNEEAKIERERLVALNKIVIGAYMNNAVFQQFALPYKIAEPFFARYRPGMYYGPHVDDPVMGGQNRYRTDVSTTLFLNNPDEYEGGELTIVTPMGTEKLKLNAGDAVVYPTSYLHNVAEVTKGERLVSVCWLQSLVRSVEKRNLLDDLATVRNDMYAENSNTLNADKVNNCYANLVRMWAEV